MTSGALVVGMKCDESRLYGEKLASYLQLYQQQRHFHQWDTLQRDSEVVAMVDWHHHLHVYPQALATSRRRHRILRTANNWPTQFRPYKVPQATEHQLDKKPQHR